MTQSGLNPQTGKDLTKREKGWIVFALMISVALAAIDVTIVSTALPTIVAELSGVALYSLLVSVYLLTSTTSVPLYGQLADNLGRKPVLIWGIVLFTFSSFLCTQAATMVQLIMFRALQGLGAGAILPMTMTIIGDLFSIEERARYQGFFSGVWGVSSIVGPALGALILTFWTWQGIFYINLPVGALAVFLVLRFFHEHKVSSHRSVDVWGALLMTAGVGAFLLAVEGRLFGETFNAGLYFAAIACIIVLVFVEKNVESPLLPMSLFKKRIIGVSYLVAIFGGITQFGVTSFIPLFVQGAMGGTPLSVGLTMAPMAIGWPIGSIMSGKLILKTGYKRVLFAGMAIGVFGSSMLLIIGSATPLIAVMGIVVTIGFSMGLTTTPVIIAVQNAVEWKQRGITTALNQFSRTIGGVLGVAVMGALLNNRLSEYLNNSTLTAGQKASDLIRDMLDPSKRDAYAPDILQSVRLDLADALNTAYLLPFIAAVIALLLIFFFFPGGKVEKLKFNNNKKRPM
ncbi:MAG: MDR family MFS transporter [Candidatus Electryonea clarkiae]|nr:MDR family MFS transporter [Candidatus Electryonea clarkiae]